LAIHLNLKVRPPKVVGAWHARSKATWSLPFL
jgi:hypothetical protein